MKRVACFVFLAFVGNSLAFQCYSCVGSNASACTTKTTCFSGQTYCRTDKATALGVSTYTKSCESTCTESSGGISGLTRASRSCCQTSLCNLDNSQPTKAPAFQCYSCVGSSLSKCTAKTGKIACNADETYCYSTKATALGLSAYTKDCAATCTESSGGIGSLAGASTTCCQDTLCNAGATVKVSIMALLLAVLTALVVHR
eukprot:m.309932 g.309932  ORF g.309932 m.309932 type:complete len:201 (+) comp48599_c0_seq1:450-1052(+)